MSQKETITYELYRSAARRQAALLLKGIHHMNHQYPWPHGHYPGQYPGQCQPPSGADMLYQLHRVHFYIQNELAKLLMGGVPYCPPQPTPPGCAPPCPPPANPCPPPQDHCSPPHKPHKGSFCVHPEVWLKPDPKDPCKAWGTFVIENRRNAHMRADVSLSAFEPDAVLVTSMDARWQITPTSNARTGNSLQSGQGTSIPIPPCSSATVTFSIDYKDIFQRAGDYTATIHVASEGKTRHFDVKLKVDRKCLCGPKGTAPDKDCAPQNSLEDRLGNLEANMAKILALLDKQNASAEEEAAPTPTIEE